MTKPIYSKKPWAKDFQNLVSHEVPYPNPEIQEHFPRWLLAEAEDHEK